MGAGGSEATSGAWAAASAEGTARRRSPVRVLVAAGTALAVVAAAAWFVLLRPSGPTGPSVALAVSFPEHHALRYRMSMLMEGKVSAAGQEVGMSVSFSGRAEMRPISTESEGTTTVLMRITHIRASANGQFVKVPDVKTRVRISSDGRMVGGDGLLPSSGGTTDFLPGSDQFTPLLPDHPVRVGEDWTEEFDRAFPLGHGDIHYQTTSHIDRFEVLDGNRAAVVESDGEISMDGVTLDLRKALAISGGEDQLPPGTNPSMSFDGAMQLVQTSWVDIRHDVLLKVQSYGPFDFTMGLEGVPGAPPGTIDMDGRLDMSLERMGVPGKAVQV
jgi:hypothetical protein